MQECRLGKTSTVISVSDAVAFAALRAEQLGLVDAGREQDAGGLVGADHLGLGVGGDHFGAGEVVEVGVADQDGVGAGDVGDGESDIRCGRDAVHVGVEEDDGVVDGEPEGGAAEPVEGDGHGEPLGITAGG